MSTDNNFDMPENGQRREVPPRGNSIYGESYGAYEVRRQEREANRRYVDVPDIELDDFAHYSDRPESERGTYYGWVAQRVHWTCHNCGNIGWKLGRVNELFKCYYCRSRNLTVIKAGDLSRLVRDGHLGKNMEDAYRERQERQAIQRRERTERRRSARRNQ